MAGGTRPISRRGALRVLGAATTASWLGTASSAAKPARNEPTGAESVRVTVGYSNAAGEGAVRERAREVVYEFAFDALTVHADRQDIEALRGLETVRYVERDGVYEISSQSVPWGVDRVDADVVHGDGDRGGGADVAIIDTGIDRGHADLDRNLGTGTAFQGGTQHDQWQDDNGHGTHVAGIVAAIDNDRGVVGVAPSATLHAVKVMTSPGAGLSSDVAKGIEWVADQGYDVANMSLGGDHLEAVADACEYAAKNGVTLVAAAGNNGPCRDCVEYPAAYPQVIAVSSTTRNDSLAGSSSQGPEIELASPGENIRSTYLGGYATRSGTSMACPHVAGAAAHLATSGRSNDGIRRKLKGSAEDIGLSSNESGAGLLDVAAALGSGSGSGKNTETSGGPQSQRATRTESEPPSAPSADTPSAPGTETGANGGTSTSPSTATRTGTGTGTRKGTGGTTGTRPRSPSTPTRGASSPSTGPVDLVVSVVRGVLDAFGAVAAGVSDALARLVP